MAYRFELTLYQISVWILPLVFAITLHEAAHGCVARLFGDTTASRLGRVSLNPLNHIDPFETVLLPALLLVTHAPFLFGYAKPVLVNFRALRNPKFDSVLVAAAGPAMNLLLAALSAVLLRAVPFLPNGVAGWVVDNRSHAVVINVLLAVFNLLSIPPLDGGRILVGLLPGGPSRALTTMEPYGMIILVAAPLLLPWLGSQTGIDLNFVWQAVARVTDAIVAAIAGICGVG